MIVKMKFLSISGPKTDIDRVCDQYLSKYEMQLENAVAELKTTDNLQPFVDLNPYREPLAKAEQFTAMIKDDKICPKAVTSQEEMLAMIREVNHDFLFLQFQKNLHQPFRCDFFSRSPLCNRLILAKNTVQGTAGKKDGSRTFCSADTRFFPEMQSCPCYF